MEAIVAARQESGPFKDIYDFCERVNMGAVNRRVMESLVKAGAFDSTGANRAQLMEALDRAIESGARASSRPRLGSARVIRRLRRRPQSEHQLAKLPDWTMEQKLARAKRKCWGSMSRDTRLIALRTRLRILPLISRISWTTSKRILRSRSCAIINSIVRKTNREGKYWAALKVDDGRGYGRRNGIRKPL